MKFAILSVFAACLMTVSAAPGKGCHPNKTTSTGPAPTIDPKCAAQYCDYACIDVFPESCYCNNANKLKCFENCGGPTPTFQTCPPTTAPTAY